MLTPTDLGIADGSRPPTPTELERAVRAALSGRRLACEAVWSRAAWERIWFTISGVTGRRDPADVAREYPASYVAYVVGVAAARSDGLEVWKHTGWPQAKQHRAGEAFEAALLTLGLERFPQFFAPGVVPARRFVSVILAHGGMPRSLAASFVRNTLIPALRAGRGATGAELVAAWRATPPAGLPKTVERFLLHGGATTVDLLDRMIDLLRMDLAGTAPGQVDEAAAARLAVASGLPAHLAAAIADIPPAERATRLRLLPRPRVELDAYGGAGPDLVLPALDRDLAPRVLWRVGTGAARTERRGHVTGDSRVPLPPEDYWRVAASGEDVPPMDMTIECFGDSRMLAFDGASGAYLPDAAGLRSSDAWIITPAGVTLGVPAGDGTRPLPVAETGASLYGRWSGYRLARYDLRGVDTILLSEAGAEVGRVAVIAEAQAHLRGPQVAGVTGLAEGEAVFSAPPEVFLPAWGAWSLRLGALGPDGDATPIAEQVCDTRDGPVTLPVAALLDGAWPHALGRFELLARGPIGSDLRATFAIVPDLAVAIPDSPLHPSAGAIEVRVTAASSIALAGRPAGSGATVPFAADQVDEQLWAWEGRDRKVGMLVRIPRIRWAVRRAGALPPALSIEPLPADTSVPEPGDALLVDTGRAGALVRLDLVDPDRSVRQQGTPRTGPGGRTEIPLDGYRDTLRGFPASRFLLRVSGEAVEITAGRAPVGPAAATAAPTGNIAPRRSLVGERVEGTVVSVGPKGLRLSLPDGVPGRVYPEAMVGGPDAYRIGEQVTGWITALGEEARIDLRPFDPAAHRAGDVVRARVTWVDDHRVRFDLGGADGIAGIEELPPGAGPGRFRIGQVEDAVIVRPESQQRRWRVTFVPVPGPRFEPGLTVEGRVRGIAGDRLVVDLGDAIATIARDDLPDGDALERHRSGETYSVRVLYVDKHTRCVRGSLRPFNAAGLAPGDRVPAVVERVVDAGVAVRLATGDPAFDPSTFIATGSVRRGDQVEVRVVSLDERRSRITVALQHDAGSWSYGDGTEDSPFAVLKRPR